VIKPQRKKKEEKFQVRQRELMSHAARMRVLFQLDTFNKRQQQNALLFPFIQINSDRGTFLFFISLIMMKIMSLFLFHLMLPRNVHGRMFKAKELNSMMFRGATEHQDYRNT